MSAVLSARTPVSYVSTGTHASRGAPQVVGSATLSENKLQLRLDTRGFVISRSPVRSRRVAPDLIHSKQLRSRADANRRLCFSNLCQNPEQDTLLCQNPWTTCTSLKCQGLSRILPPGRRTSRRVELDRSILMGVGPQESIDQRLEHPKRQ